MRKEIQYIENVWQRQGQSAFILHHHGWRTGEEVLTNRVSAGFYGDPNLSECNKIAEDAADLMVDAGNTFIQTGSTPSQLLQENKELKERNIELVEENKHNSFLIGRSQGQNKQLKDDLEAQLGALNEANNSIVELNEQRDKMLKELDRLKPMTNSASVRIAIHAIQIKYSGKQS